MKENLSVEDGVDIKASKEDAIFQDQSSRLPLLRLLFTFSGLALGYFLSFLDQTSVATVTSSIAAELHAGASISWVGASFLIANTTFQLISGRFSDIFGRKNILMICLGIFTLGDLLCGFARSEIQLYAFRAIAGIGGGGINSLCMIIVSDICSLKDRGKYQGFMGVAVALGSGIGPLAGGFFAQNITWRWVFWFTIPLSIFCMVQISFIPITRVQGDIRKRLLQIDYLGSVLSTIAVLLILVPVSLGGVTLPWTHPAIIGMLEAGLFLTFTFILYEWKGPRLPILPLRIFKIRSVSIIMLQTGLVGIIYYGNLFFLPVYFQSVLEFSPSKAGVFLIPLIVTQAISSPLAGLVMSKTERYNPTIWFGFALWIIGLAAQVTFDQNTPTWRIVLTLMVEGFGVGCTFQPTLVAAQATAPKGERAVVTSLRNFFRNMGGAFGLTILGSIFNSRVASILNKEPHFPPNLLDQLTSTRDLPHMLPTQMKVEVISAFMSATRTVFIIFVPISVVVGILSLFVKDVRLGESAEAKKVSVEFKVEDPIKPWPGLTPNNAPGGPIQVNRRYI